jgi:hypothetical protein
MADEDKKKSSGRVKKVATRVTLVAIASFGVVGLFHTKWLKPILMKAGGCPVASPEAVEKAQNIRYASDTATAIAPARFALGFELDVQKRDDVLKWARSKALTCKELRDGAVVNCDNVPVSALPIQSGAKSDITELTFGFRLADDTLNNVTTWREAVSTDIGANDIDAVATTLQEKLGNPTKQTGERTKKFFEGSGMPTAVVNYDFKEYKATVSANRMQDGVWMREVYLSTKVVQGS